VEEWNASSAARPLEELRELPPSFVEKHLLENLRERMSFHRLLANPRLTLTSAIVGPTTGSVDFLWKDPKWNEISQVETM
jgi:hypothetical protein